MDWTHARIALDLLESDQGGTLADRAALMRQSLVSIDSLLRLATTGSLPLHLAFAELCAARWLRLHGSARGDLGNAPFEGRQADDLERSARAVLKHAECYLYLESGDSQDAVPG
jgi:hypothetical protein